MIALAEKLSAGIPEVRVDLYEVNGNIFFGPQSFRPLVLTTLLVTIPNTVFLSYNFKVRQN